MPKAVESLIKLDHLTCLLDQHLEWPKSLQLSIHRLAAGDLLFLPCVELCFDGASAKTFHTFTVRGHSAAFAVDALKGIPCTYCCCYFGHYYMI